MKKSLLLAFLMLLLCQLTCLADDTASVDYNLGKAVELMEDGDLEGAISYTDTHIQENPKSFEGHYHRGYFHYLSETYGSALQDITYALKLWNKKCSVKKNIVHQLRGDIYFKLEKYEKALEEYSAAFKIAKKSDDLRTIQYNLWRLASTYGVLGDTAKEDAEYKRMLEYDETNTLALVGLLNNMINRKEYSEALEMVNECLKFDNTYADFYAARMIIHDELGETDKAIDDALSYLDLLDDPDPNLCRSVLTKHMSYAIAKAQEKEIDSNDRSKWIIIASTLYEWNYDFINALKEYNKLEEELGIGPYIHFYKSNCYHELGASDKAIEEISKCIQMTDERNHNVLTQRAFYYRDCGRFDEAIEDFNKAIELRPSDSFGHCGIGMCYEMKGDINSALKYYTDGIDLDKENHVIHFRRASLLAYTGQTEAAKADYEVVMSIDTVAADMSCRQFALHALGQDSAAIEWQEKIIESNPKDYYSDYDYAQLLSLMGRPNEAIQVLRTSLEKGYRKFTYMEYDRNLDAIRNLPEFTALIEEFKNKTITTFENDSMDTEFSENKVAEVDIKRLSGGTYEVDCIINDLPLKFILDTGASTVTISSVEASFMLKNGYLTASDIKGTSNYSTATGEIHEGTTIKLREIKLGSMVLKNITATVIHNQQAPLLLGQSVLERFGTITIDNINSKLLIQQF